MLWVVLLPLLVLGQEGEGGREGDNVCHTQVHLEIIL